MAEPLRLRPSTPIPNECEFSSENFGGADTNFNECNNNNQTEEYDPNKPPSYVILHKIASYLSIGDAESMASLSHGGSVASHSSVLLTGYHSLDAWCLRNSPSERGVDPQFQQTLSSIVDFEEEDTDEGWFVGNVGRTPHMALSPLEEWGNNEWEEGEGGRDWTPAGEPTCEKNDVDVPGLTVVPREEDSDEDCSDSAGSSSASFAQEQRLRKRALQHKLAQAVFAHPHPLRDYCLDAYATAVRLSRKRARQQQQQGPNPNPETLRHRPDMSPSSKLHYCNEEMYPELGEHAHEKANMNNSSAMMRRPNQLRRKRTSRKHNKSKLIRVLVHKILDSIPLSILLDLLESTFDLSIDTTFAFGKLSINTLHNLLTFLSNTAFSILSSLSSINIFELALSAHRSVNKTGEVLASGLQSVATGVGSASNAALERLSRQGLALAGAGLSRGGGGGMRGGSGGCGVVENPLESKLFRRLHKMDNVSKLVSYSERIGEEALGRAQKKRAQRMMHYNVSFRPFTATIQPATPKKGSKIRHSVSFELSVASPGTNDADDLASDNDSLSSESLYSNSGSIFMRTPTSFPPTPTSRLYYFERGSRFTENVIFLARDQLRVERGLDNTNEQTRAMSKALREGSRLAVFDAESSTGGGIALSCGQHIATKVGNALYCSTRCMIPVMRNSFVYFEISVSPPPTVNDQHRHQPQLDVATLSIGLSTLEMPLNTLVGAWKGSVGLCTTGQVLLAGHWYAPADTQESSYGSNSTVGCLVYLDDTALHDTPEGQMVTADITFNVNGVVIPPVESSRPPGEQHPTGQRNASLASQQYEEIDDAPTLSLLVPRTQELFPTVTLHSPATCVMCRFNSDDLLANSREEIGAPDGVTIFSVDGSIIIDSSSGSMDMDDDWIADSCDDFTQFTHDEVAL